jgi:ABC-type spermidine/putrescine transport system permease subunit II
MLAFSHMITGVIIGIIYSTLSQNIKKLYITSVYKGVGTGILTGIVVWGVLFLPINYVIMQPTLNNMVDSSNPASSEYLMAKQLLELSNVIILGSLVLHIVFGGVMGFCARLAVT